MRPAWVIAMLVLGASAAEAKPSNPAFLGIQMNDLRQGSPSCVVGEVTRGSGAKAAGLQRGDLIASIDGAQIVNCDAVLRNVQSHQPGDTVQIVVLRNGRPRELSADLVSRDEILRRRLVGRPLATEVLGVDDQRTFDLSEMRGRTAIVGWFHADKCVGCAAVFSKIGAWSRDADRVAPLAITAGKKEDAKQLAKLGFDVPLALADDKAFDELTISADGDRINFMVIDGRGVVQYVAPISPDGDDTAAAIDELLAAAEQAARRTK